MNRDIGIEYYHRPEWCQDTAGADAHARCIELLSELKARQLIDRYQARTAAESFSADAERDLLRRLRHFASARGIRLGRRFGSNKHHFSWLPARFLIVSRAARWLAVFPCELESGYVMPEDYLESLLTGEPWTIGSRSRNGADTAHERIVKQLASQPDLLERGLRFEARDVFVSAGDERGYIDLLFRDSEDRFLIVEVKVGPTELDKATGQVRRHRRLFAEMNSIDSARIRIALACPEIPLARLAEFQELAIGCFVVANGRSATGELQIARGHPK
jgi:hypothetical protein